MSAENRRLLPRITITRRTLLKVAPLVPTALSAAIFDGCNRPPNTPSSPNQGAIDAGSSSAPSPVAKAPFEQVTDIFVEAAAEEGGFKNQKTPLPTQLITDSTGGQRSEPTVSPTIRSQLGEIATPATDTRQVITSTPNAQETIDALKAENDKLRAAAAATPTPAKPAPNTAIPSPRPTTRVEPTIAPSTVIPAKPTIIPTARPVAPATSTPDNQKRTSAQVERPLAPNRERYTSNDPTSPFEIDYDPSYWEIGEKPGIFLSKEVISLKNGGKSIAASVLIFNFESPHKTLQEYIDEEMTPQTMGPNWPEEELPRPSVNGHEAFVFTIKYTETSSGRSNLSKIYGLRDKQGRFWHIVLNVDQSGQEKTIPLFNEMLTTLVIHDEKPYPSNGAVIGGKAAPTAVPKPTEKVIPPTAIPTKSSEAKPEQGWKEFTSTGMPYRINYPAQWEQSSVLGALDTFYRSSTDPNRAAFAGAGVVITKYAKQDWVSLDNIVGQEIERLQRKNIARFERKPRLIDGQKGEQLTYAVQPDPSLMNLDSYGMQVLKDVVFESRVLVVKGNEVWDMKLGTTSANATPDYEVFQKMLNTFKFLR